MREAFWLLRSVLLQLLLDHFLDRVGGSFIIAAHHVRIDIQRDGWIGETVLSGTSLRSSSEAWVWRSSWNRVSLVLMRREKAM